MERWIAYFSIETNQTEKIKTFLENKLRHPNTFQINESTLTLMIISPTKDECFKTGQWFRYNNPLNKPLNYSVIGTKNKQTIYISYCKKCRAGEPHNVHS